MNLRPSGYEPDELPDLASPRTKSLHPIRATICDCIDQHVFRIIIDHKSDNRLSACRDRAQTRCNFVPDAAFVGRDMERGDYRFDFCRLARRNFWARIVNDDTRYGIEVAGDKGVEFDVIVHALRAALSVRLTTANAAS